VSRAPKSPLRWDTWSSCSTCGSWIPSRWVTLTRKHGYQCLPGNGITRGCFDGNWDRDDIYYVYPANEGTRDTTSPLTNFATQGVTAGDSYTIYTLYDRADPTLTYDVTFSTGDDGTISWQASTSGNPAVGGIGLNNGWTVYIQEGFMQFSENIEIKGAVPWQGSGDLAVIGGFLQYTPYVQATV
jgi:hypothetical protein